MKQLLSIVSLALAGLFVQPALADHEQHQHGDGAARTAEQADSDSAKGHDMAAMDDMKGGGKSCKKCKKGMAGDTEVQVLEDRVRQLEKRVDLMQTMLEMLAERPGGSGRGGQR